MKSVVVLLLPLLLFGGCNLFGLGGESNSACSMNNGLTVQTMRESYSVGEEVDLEIENCTQKTIYLAGGYCDGFTPPFYKLEKNIDSSWKQIDEKSTLLGSGSRDNIPPKTSCQVSISITPDTSRVEFTTGLYRFNVFLGTRSRLLADSMRVSNTFQVKK